MLSGKEQLRVVFSNGTRVIEVLRTSAVVKRSEYSIFSCEVPVSVHSLRDHSKLMSRGHWPRSGGGWWAVCVCGKRCVCVCVCVCVCEGAGG